MKISKKIVYSVFLIIVSIFLIIALLPANENNVKGSGNKNVDYNKLDKIVFNVSTQKVIKGNLVKKISANGIVKADKELDVTSNINGVITGINVYEGKHVNKNDLLIKLDDREYKINIREAEERIIEAKVNYGLLIKDAPTDTTKNKEKRIIEMQLNQLEEDYNNSIISKREYDEIKEELDMKLIFTGAKREELILNKSGYNAAINQIDRARLNLEYTEIRAPFSGKIGDFNLVTGQRITAGEKLFKLFKTNIMKIDINVLESELNKIQTGNNVEIKINALQEEKFTGKVSQISPYIDSENRTTRVIITIKNIDSKIKPGMFANVLVASKTLTGRTLIPKEALLVRDKRTLVFTVQDSLAKWKYVDIGEQNDKYIEIKNGIDAGEVVIVKGHFNLAHDSKVNIVN